jgi:hypothetical protein
MRFGALVALALLFAGCSETIYYQPGASTAEAQADEVACGRIALAQAPVEKETEIIPGRYLPGPVVCDANNNCRRQPGRRLPPQIITRDVNEELRRLIARQCMAERGYERLTLPYCSEEVKAQVTPAITRRMPQLSGRACIIRRGADRYQIVGLSGG